MSISALSFHPYSPVLPSCLSARLPASPSAHLLVWLAGCLAVCVRAGSALPLRWRRCLGHSSRASTPVGLQRASVGQGTCPRRWCSLSVTASAISSAKALTSCCAVCAVLAEQQRSALIVVTTGGRPTQFGNCQLWKLSEPADRSWRWRKACLS